jgi:hypothetical protein
MSRKRFTVEFKDEACKLVTSEGCEPSEAARKPGDRPKFTTSARWAAERHASNCDSHRPSRVSAPH